MKIKKKKQIQTESLSLTELKKCSIIHGMRIPGKQRGKDWYQEE